jgi:hypothetical protein
MEYANIELRLSNSMLNTITKTVTAPEACILEHLNGEGSVIILNVIGTVGNTDRAERERIILQYGKDGLERCYPGAAPLHKTFLDAGFEGRVPEVAKKPKTLN